MPCHGTLLAGPGPGQLCAKSLRASKSDKRPFRCHQQVRASKPDLETQQDSTRRRSMLGQIASLAAAMVISTSPALAASLPVEEDKVLCGAECTSNLDQMKTVNLPSGLQYKEIREGKGPSPPVGFQVVANYVAMVPNGKVFDSSLEKGHPYDIRIGTGQVIPGLDEGIKSMKVGGLRRLYIPGNLAFPKGLSSAAGRPRVPPSSPVVFDVELLLVPGLESDEE